MTQTIKVEVKQVYGVERIYPACEVAKKLNSLMPSKTFSRQDIDVIKSLGYNIQVQSATL
jgi:hypothetical protein